MKSLETSYAATLDHAHLILGRDKKPLAVLQRDGVVIEATLENEGRAVGIKTYDLYGTPVGSLLLPYEAFDEILEMVIGFGKA